MLIANQKLKENIAEYILYMWQIEDMIRACSFEIDCISENLISQMTDDESQIEEIKIWYEKLIRKMKSEKLQERGHVSSLLEIINELILLHNMLLTTMNDEKYKEIYNDASKHLNEFREKVPNSNLSDVELCLTGLYGKLLLKMKKKEISEQTEVSFSHFSKVLAYLSLKFKQMKSGDLNFQMN